MMNNIFVYIKYFNVINYIYIQASLFKATKQLIAWLNLRLQLESRCHLCTLYCESISHFVTSEARMTRHMCLYKQTTLVSATLYMGTLNRRLTICTSPGRLSIRSNNLSNKSLFLTSSPVDVFQFLISQFFLHVVTANSKFED